MLHFGLLHAGIGRGLTRKIVVNKTLMFIPAHEIILHIFNGYSHFNQPSRGLSS